ncbi:conserved hypothetical protein [Bathymodiolus platifrons methanotrophic gill symbiont]|uniref:rhodanese-like domain-containing protein n=1 Tax=Bathymodiolus platifrons methanotrophic gill symbiont TaxID=113268 RepID=UPI000B411500|nr:rhodanese-like domain-containing protein [Bathymodiolus platifrons methanotrophic gill symbiont]MCK5870916.1 rhodanese-like domain-containing protein [Methyloprofundus sp.]TXK99807.1 rhodanese [Methylococcaceae bacterium CS5]TXL10902.1 rhodanese [Methylococcaceae bacterium CS2]GAW86727.1 conserved hypothetical protein [Bathymodiolus platifrons methanotrophic gill symbiont]GFO73836.1 hypothetical protein BPLS_P0136 [Bathymodiolus platifrons methanotrophic gill symbiont]
MSIKHALIFLFIFSSKTLIAAELINLTTNEVNNKLTQDALVIDIRTPAEWQRTGIIPGSHPVKFFDKNGKFDADKWLATVKQLQSSPDQAIILVCQSGRRSGRVGHYLTDKLDMSNVSHLQNGISSWIKEKRPTETSCAPTQTC